MLLYHYLCLETSHASGIPIVNLKGASSSQVNRYQDENGTIQSRTYAY